MKPGFRSNRPPKNKRSVGLADAWREAQPLTGLPAAGSSTVPATASPDRTCAHIPYGLVHGRCDLRRCLAGIAKEPEDTGRGSAQPRLSVQAWTWGNKRLLLSS